MCKRLEGLFQDRLAAEDVLFFLLALFAYSERILPRASCSDSPIDLCAYNGLRNKLALAFYSASRPMHWSRRLAPKRFAPFIAKDDLMRMTLRGLLKR